MALSAAATTRIRPRSTRTVWTGHRTTLRLSRRTPRSGAAGARGIAGAASTAGVRLVRGSSDGARAGADAGSVGERDADSLRVSRGWALALGIPRPPKQVGV